MVGLGFSSSSASSDPKDVTPEAFKALQAPFAQVLAQLLGFEPTTTDTGGVLALGGGGGGGGSGDVKQQLATDETARQQAFVDRSADKEGGIAFQVAGPTAAGGGGGGASDFQVAGDGSDPARGIPSPGGPFAAPITGAEQDILAQLSGGGLSASQDLLTRTIGGEFLPGQEGSNPFLQSAIEAAQRTTLQGLEETLTRSLPGRFTQGGQFTQPEGSSAFDRAAAIATRGVAGEIADIASELSFAGFESERGRQQEAATQLPQVSAQEVNTLINNLQAQALPRLIEQAGIEGGIEAFNKQITNLLQVLAIAQGASQPLVAQESKSSSFGANFSISDIRMKRDVERVGTTDKGLPLYLFRYHDEGPEDARRLGVMAQDVEKVRPEAVAEDHEGIKMVDYRKALA